MKVTMLEFRKNADRVLGEVRNGRRILLTYRGKPVARLEPVGEESPAKNDPFYRLAEIADAKGSGLNNKEIDRLIYGV
jgi:antitoxin (DNA-binding transcriptional repressor) of toxin-antitoxin stability system